MGLSNKEINTRSRVTNNTQGEYLTSDFSAALCVPSRLPPSVNTPLLARCWRCVLMKKGDDEEGEHLHSWLPEEPIIAAYYFIKQLGAPTAPRLWEMFSPWWHSAVMSIDSSWSMLHVCSDVTAQAPVRSKHETICNDSWGERTEGDNTAPREAWWIALWWS